MSTGLFNKAREAARMGETLKDTDPTPNPVPAPTPDQTAVVHAPTSGAIVASDEFAAMGFDLGANMEGVEPRLPLVKILPQAQMFNMPDDSKVVSIQGIIIETHRTNAWWPRTGDAAEGNLPSCASMDGVRPQPDYDAPQCATCAECQQNRYGSDMGPGGQPAKGKACKNMRRIYVLLEGHELPYLLTLSPTSLKNFDAYAVTLTDQKRPIPTVITEITLSKAQNGSNVYSKAEFRVLERIDDRAKLGRILALKRQLQETVRHQAITAEEYVNGDAAGSTPDPF